jgi:hypothetical protein
MLGHNPSASYAQLKVAAAAAGFKTVKEYLRHLAEEKAKKIIKCELIHFQYDKVEEKCRKCVPESDPLHKINNCVCWSAVAAGRSLYLSMKCDYVLPGSLSKPGGAKEAEKGHKKRLAEVSATVVKCCGKPCDNPQDALKVLEIMAKGPK